MTNSHSNSRAWGLTFNEARGKIEKAIHDALHSNLMHQNQFKSTYSESIVIQPFILLANVIGINIENEALIYIYIPSIFCISIYLVLFFISFSSGNNAKTSSSLLWPVVILILVNAINVYILLAIQSNSQNEVKNSIKNIVTDYQKSIQIYNDAESYNQHPVLLDHPHVSMISCWRNDTWQRLPVLLLVDGDIIALMGGDVTPCDVYELLPTVRSRRGNRDWKLGEKIKGGETIRLRRSRQNSHGNEKSTFAQHSFVRHRALPPDSIELLILSGDIRCFQMAETPITSFTKQILAKNNDTNQSFFQHTNLYELKGQCNGQSFIRKLFSMIFMRGVHVYLPLLLLLMVSVYVIKIWLLKRDYSWESLLLSCTTILMNFVPIAMPFCMLLTESFVVSDILATIEGNLLVSAKMKMNQSNEILSSVNSDIIQSNNEEGNKYDDMSSESSSDSDEFLDEDIDEREEEIAEEASERVEWMRYCQYFVYVFLHRLGIVIKPIFNNQLPFLPVPFIKTRFLETLGSITMVCFIDEDIVSEGYSVAEELYLLSDEQEGGTTNKKGTVLDLHANTEAEGSRFENSSWWKYLPNLKPIALTSMLTYASAMSQDILNGDVAVDGADSKSVSPSRHNVELVSTRTTRIIPMPMETALVRHIRKTIPLESLKELADEIGFQVEDCKKFSTLVELTVLAPRLGDAQLLEDKHMWGQEGKSSLILINLFYMFDIESRRRGTLLSHVRSVIVRDQKGVLQMLTQGEPSLVIKYCSEYWNGKGIASLDSSDKADILKLHDRYRKEDFDVIAFAYSPIPAALQPLILAAIKHENREVRSGLRSKTSRIYHKNMSKFKGFDKTDIHCVLFVDPSTSTDLTSINRKTHFQNNSDNKTEEDADIDNHITSSNELSERSDNISGEVSEMTKRPPNKVKPSKSDSDIFTPSASSGKNTCESPLLDAASDNVSQFPADDSIMLTSSKSLNTEILIKEMEQLDNHEDINIDVVMHEIQSSSSNSNSKLILGTPKTSVDDNSSIPDSSNYLLTPTSQNIYSPNRINRNDQRNRSFSLDEGKNDEKSPKQTFLDDTFIPQGTLSDAMSDFKIRRSSPQESLVRTDASVMPKRSSTQSLDDIDVASLPIPETSYPIVRTQSMMATSDILSLKKNSLSPPILSEMAISPGFLSTSNLNQPIRTPNPRVKADAILHNKTHQRQRSIAAQLWPIMRQQVFLGLAASSVPIRSEIPDLLENLNFAGLRFIYFSPRNMRKSKPIATKIGIPFDWNCAISLRTLTENNPHDPYRYISSYADWDVLARMPHGVEQIKKHLESVDNVPLLVNLYTDATPSSTSEMIRVFRQYGEVVLSIGSSLRVSNQNIFNESNISVSIGMLLDDTTNSSTNCDIPSSIDKVLSKLPLYCPKGLCRSDLLLIFRMVGLDSIPLLQLPSLSTYSPSMSAILETKRVEDINLASITEGKSVNSYYDHICLICLCSNS